MGANSSAFAATDHAAATPANRLMNSRRFTVRTSRVSDRKASTPRCGRRLLRCGISTRLMTGAGHERPKGDVCVESVRLPTADIGRRKPQVVFAPADSRRASTTSPPRSIPRRSRIRARWRRPIWSRLPHKLPPLTPRATALSGWACDEDHCASV
jgi:hypothetical protein